MSDSIREISDQIEAFNQARKWVRLPPKDLAISVVLEASELLEHYQWVAEERVEECSCEHHGDIADEMADVAIYLFQFADRIGVNLAEAIEKKLKKNGMKYPENIGYLGS